MALFAVASGENLSREADSVTEETCATMDSEIGYLMLMPTVLIFSMKSTDGWQWEQSNFVVVKGLYGAISFLFSALNLTKFISMSFKMGNYFENLS